MFNEHVHDFMHGHTQLRTRQYKESTTLPRILSQTTIVLEDDICIEHFNDKVSRSK